MHDASADEGEVRGLGAERWRGAGDESERGAGEASGTTGARMHDGLAVRVGGTIEQSG